VPISRRRALKLLTPEPGCANKTIAQAIKTRIAIISLTIQLIAPQRITSGEKTARET
jgi:hypothetical protein